MELGPQKGALPWFWCDLYYLYVCLCPSRLLFWILAIFTVTNWTIGGSGCYFWRSVMWRLISVKCNKVQTCWYYSARQHHCAQWHIWHIKTDRYVRGMDHAGAAKPPQPLFSPSCFISSPRSISLCASCGHPACQPVNVPPSPLYVLH